MMIWLQDKSCREFTHFLLQQFRDTTNNDKYEVSVCLTYSFDMNALGLLKENRAEQKLKGNCWEQLGGGCKKREKGKWANRSGTSVGWLAE